MNRKMKRRQARLQKRAETEKRMKARKPGRTDFKERLAKSLKAREIALTSLVPGVVETVDGKQVGDGAWVLTVHYEGAFRHLSVLPGDAEEIARAVEKALKARVAYTAPEQETASVVPFDPATTPGQTDLLVEPETVDYGALLDGDVNIPGRGASEGR